MEEELSSLNIEISEAKLENNEEKKAKQIKEEKNLGENTQPFDPKITSKFTFDKKILKINELSNNRLGILLPDSLLIYNLNNLKKIDEIQLPFTGTCYDDDKIFNFVELKNSDLVLLSSKKYGRCSFLIEHPHIIVLCCSYCLSNYFASDIQNYIICNFCCLSNLIQYTRSILHSQDYQYYNASYNHATNNNLLLVLLQKSKQTL